MTGAASAPQADVLVFMDGDGSDMPEYIPALLTAVESGADLALGVRRGPKVEPGSMTAAARFGNWLSAILLGIMYGRRLKDLSPLKAVRRPLFEQLEHRELTYGWTVELLAGSLRARARIAEIDVGYRRRAGGKSKVSGDLRVSARAGASILLTIARTAFPRLTPAVRGATAGFVTVAALLGLFTLVLGSVDTATLGAWVAVWLLAWPVLLGGMLVGYGVGRLFGAA
jgi:hypothetical protein